MGYRGYQVQFRLEIAGVDCTRYIVSEQALTVSVARDFPNLGVFKSRGLDILVYNADHSFSPDAAVNRFTQANLPASGRGARVLFQATVTRRGTGGTSEVFTYAGTIQMVVEQLSKTTATLIVRDLSVLLRQSQNINIGETLTRVITDFPGATKDYTEDFPAFRFPDIFLPIFEDTISVSIVGANLVKTALTVVDEIGISGVPSHTRVKVDENHLIFESAPPLGANTKIEATWITNLRHHTISFIIKQILNATLSVQLPFFAIDSDILSLPAPIFMNLGKPNWANPNITRWMLPDTTNQMIYLIQGNTLVKYSPISDSYTQLTMLPEKSGIEGIVGFGNRLADDDITLSNTTPSSNLPMPFQIYENTVLSVKPAQSLQTAILSSYNLDGSVINLDFFTADVPGIADIIRDMAIYNNRLYLLIYNVSSGVARFTVASTPLPLTSSSSLTVHFSTTRGASTSAKIAVTSTRIYVGANTTLHAFTHTGTRMASEQRTFASSIKGLAATSSHLIVLLPNIATCWGYLLSNFAKDLEVTVDTETSDLCVWEDKWYVKQRGETAASWNLSIQAYALGTNYSYDEMIGWYLLSSDYRNFYIFATNTANGDVLSDTLINTCEVYQYDSDTNTLVKRLDNQFGQPQLSMAYDLVKEQRNLADNRKSFVIINRNNKDYLFYRRVQSQSAGVAYYDVTANTVTDIYKETWTGNAHKGLPYSIDFMVDERSDGVYIYTFVVSYTLQSASLKVYRKRVLPDASQSEIFSESWSSITESTYFPTSVSGVMLADDRSKIYFVLDYRRRDVSLVGKAELCTIAKSGLGSRTVLKTYDNPLVCARSPLHADGKYYYVEGGWVRRPAARASEAVDAYDYPNTGGHLIEVLSDDTITDYGVLLRSVSYDQVPEVGAARYLGYGLHNSVTSNLIKDTDGNLRVIVGYGLPVTIETNQQRLPEIGPVSAIDNFVSISYGTNFRFLIKNLSYGQTSFWEVISRLALMAGYQVGMIPQESVVRAYLTANPSADEWEAYASLFFSKGQQQFGSLRTGFAARVLGPAQLVNFDSGAVSVAASLQSNDAYSLSSSHASTAGLELVALSFGGDALKVIGGAGTGDLTIDVNITSQSVKATPVLYYKDGSAPTSNTDGTVLPWSTGPTFTNNAVTAQAATGEVDDADLNRYYWIVPEKGTDVNFDSGAVSVIANLQSDDAYDLSSSHSNTAGLELVALSFGGDALKITQGGGLGDLTLTVNVTAQSAAAAAVLMYKDGVPSSSVDGTQVGSVLKPSGANNALTGNWQLTDVPLNRYYWLHPIGNTKRFDSGDQSSNANLSASSAYHLPTGIADGEGLTRVALGFGGNAIRVDDGGGLGDLRINGTIAQGGQSVGAAPLLYYKDGRPSNNQDGTQISWTSLTWTGSNGYQVNWTSGEVTDADVGRYYWIRPGAATNITNGTVRVRFDYIPYGDFDSGAVSLGSQTLGRHEAFELNSALASTPELDLIDLSFEGQALKVAGGGGGADLEISVSVPDGQASLKQIFLYYKDGIPTSVSDGNSIAYSSLTLNGTGYDLTWSQGAVLNPPVNRYYWLAFNLDDFGTVNNLSCRVKFKGLPTSYEGSPIATNITNGTVGVEYDYISDDLSPVPVDITGGAVRVRFDYTTYPEVAPTVQIDGVGIDDFPPGLCLIGRELFRYTGRSVNGAGIQLSGVTRAVGGSVRQAHTASSAVYFVDRLLKDDDDSMLNISNKRLDLQNLRNKIVIPFQDGDETKNHIVEDSTSIGDEGEWELSLSNTYFSKFDEAWMERLAQTYLARFKSPRTVLQAQVPLSLSIQNGDVVVLRTDTAALIDYLPFEVMGFVHDFRKFQTNLELRAL